MVNFRDPNVILKDGWALVKLCHAIDSLYLWEFFTSLDYEWSVIRGRRPYRWTIWIYSLTRMSALVAVILNLVGIDVTSPFDCQAWITFVLIFAYIAFAAASLLIVLRDIAIWNRNMVIIAISIGAWVVNVAFLIQGIARLRSKWYHVVDSCVPTNTESNKLNIIVTLVTDVILLLIMLVGLIRLRRNGAGTFGLGQLLWRQGVIWFFFATVAEVPPTVFVSLNLNTPFNLMFQVPALTIMTICATRMYRSLTDFAYSFSDIVQDDLQASDPTVPRAEDIPRRPIPFTRVEVAMYTTYEQYPASQTRTSLSSHGSSLGADGQLCGKPPCLSVDSDPESQVSHGRNHN